MSTRLGVWSTTFRSEGQYDSSTCFLRSTQLRVRTPHSSTGKIHTEEIMLFFPKLNNRNAPSWNVRVIFCTVKKPFPSLDQGKRRFSALS
jgi:hypothetical protein